MILLTIMSRLSFSCADTAGDVKRQIVLQVVLCRIQQAAIDIIYGFLEQWLDGLFDRAGNVVSDIFPRLVQYLTHVAPQGSGEGGAGNILTLFNLASRTEVVACRGTGEPTCVMSIALSNGTP